MAGRSNAVVAPIRPADPDDDLIVTLKRRDLRELVREEADRALADSRTQVEPDLIDGVEMARRISVSRTTLHRLRVEGMPAIRVGDTYRYRPAAVIAWLESRGET